VHVIKKLEKLGDRLLSRVVPKVEASAGTQGCVGTYCGCIFGFLAYRPFPGASCGKCSGMAC
jgi:hypothetical protein